DLGRDLRDQHGRGGGDAALLGGGRGGGGAPPLGPTPNGGGGGGGGAGGGALTYWALRKAGMRRREVARRMIAFVSLHYAFYPLALIVFGLLLRTGVLSGADSVELTIIPAAVAGVLLVLGVLVTLIPKDLEARLLPHAHGEHTRSFVEWASRVPETLGE